MLWASDLNFTHVFHFKSTRKDNAHHKWLKQDKEIDYCPYVLILNNENDEMASFTSASATNASTSSRSSALTESSSTVTTNHNHSVQSLRLTASPVRAASSASLSESGGGGDRSKVSSHTPMSRSMTVSSSRSSLMRKKTAPVPEVPISNDNWECANVPDILESVIQKIVSLVQEGHKNILI